MERTCTKGERVCIVVNICNTTLPRGSDLGLYDGKNMYFCSSFLYCSIIGEGVLELTRSEVFSLESGLAVDQIHRSSCFFPSFHCEIVDLPPLESLPNDLLMQNFPSLITSRILDPQPGEAILDCCAAPGNKWSHLCMLMQDKGLVLGMDRSRKKAIDNLLAIKQKFGYQSLQIRYLDMTKVRI